MTHATFLRPQIPIVQRACCLGLPLLAALPGCFHVPDYEYECGSASWPCPADSDAGADAGSPKATVNTVDSGGSSASSSTSTQVPPSASNTAANPSLPGPEDAGTPSNFAPHASVEVPGNTGAPNSMPSFSTVAPTSSASLAVPSASSSMAPVFTCGNGRIDNGENCDDGNTAAKDGCSDTCRVEAGWVCASGEPSVCSPVCGDGLLVGEETKAGRCDDQNTRANDGCSASCRVETNYTCEGQASVCDLDECTANQHDCSSQATCTNTKGSFTCACKAGYVGNGKSCERPSCVGLANNCGPNSNESCCVSPMVTGGSFTMGGKTGATAATVADFSFDKYEVTVGRFRQFVAAYNGPPASGTGAHPLISGSGWQTAWNGNIAANSGALASAVQCNSTEQTWDTTGKNDRLPMNCVSWFEAFAFCTWDGGRLPTEAEWEYAATGGAEQRLFPWGDAPDPQNNDASAPDYANYCSVTDACIFKDIVAAGSKPKGAGKWGQLDLAGSMAEWTLDWYSDVPPDSCVNCANTGSGSERVFKGADWQTGNGRTDNRYQLRASARVRSTPERHSNTSGFRCARMQ